ncbi:hypothetical protein Ccrd_026246 [Cynara cardunculus var. scolymus]|uniref:Uncharacterized protein n=1 Tax=Cynara cardunculus var. scolymus TaxID=59895 RepID=A0A118HW79_CYNCS|nr:hypothetical protein Ccrd_026246 [Cynara cardunculus var. scolymus]
MLILVEIPNRSPLQGFLLLKHITERLRFGHLSRQKGKSAMTNYQRHAVEGLWCLVVLH